MRLRFQLEPERSASPWFLGIIGAATGLSVGFLNGGAAGAIGGLIIGGVIATLLEWLRQVSAAKRRRGFADMVAETDRIYIEFLRRQVGDCVDEMIHNRVQAERQLTSSNAKIRRAALNILDQFWRTTVEADFARKCEEIATHDVDPGVRGRALRILGRCHANTHDIRVLKLLAQIVLDETQPLVARIGAYIGLLSLRGVNIDPTRVESLHDIDFAFVRSFLQGGSEETGRL